MGRGSLQVALAVAGILGLPALAGAQQPGPAPAPIPSGNSASQVEQFTGKAAKPRRVKVPRVPRHPFMAPNGRSNIHNDAYMTGVYRGRSGALGRDVQVSSALFVRECASVTFDRRGRIVTICVGLDRPVLALLHPVTFEPLATHELPPRRVEPPFTDFSSGGYFYLDQRDRAVIPTAEGRVLVVATPEKGTGFVVRREHELGPAVPEGDAIVSVLPDWSGRIWFATRDGNVGWITRKQGRVRFRALGERIGNSFAVDETGGVFIVTNQALYRFEARRGRPRTTWRRTYRNTGELKPGQTEPGSGATPALMGRRWVAITDNGDPMRVVVVRRGRGGKGGRRVCTEPVFTRGAGATDQSLISTGRSVVVENNYGYTGPGAVAGGRTTTPGLQRVAVKRRGNRCRTAWRSPEIAPSVVPKLAARSGLVFTYTKPPLASGADAWYLTAIDFRSGRTVFRRLAGTGAAYNNNWAPVTIGPDEATYVGALVGITSFRDDR